MAQTKSKTVVAECTSCKATGIYVGFAEPEGVGVRCLDCGSTGKVTITYRPFTVRKLRRDVEIVRDSQGSFLPLGIGPSGLAISYADFVKPKKKMKTASKSRVQSKSASKSKAKAKSAKTPAKPRR